MSDAKKRWMRGLVYVLLADATLAAYWPVRNNGFIVLDDSEYVAQNAEVKSGLTLHGLHCAFTLEAVRTRFSSIAHLAKR